MNACSKPDKVITTYADLHPDRYNSSAVRPLPCVLHREAVPHSLPCSDGAFRFRFNIRLLLRRRPWRESYSPTHAHLHLNPSRANWEPANPAPPGRDHAICPPLRVRYTVIKLYIPGMYNIINFAGFIYPFNAVKSL